MKVFLVTMLFVGCVLVLFNQVSATNCTPERVVYKYVPMDLEEQLQTQALPSTLYTPMFLGENVGTSASR
jgi:hypothetical protein